MKRRWLILGATILVGGCGGNKAGTNSAEDVRLRRDTEIVLEKCDVTSSDAKKVDADGDGKPEMTQVSKAGRETCRTADLNFDGRIDRTTFFDEKGAIRRVESDFDRDGLVDEIAFYQAGVIKEKWRATTLDGKLDTWDFFDKDQVVRTERDENGDGVIDQWWEYPSRGCPLIHVDTDGDGRPDPGASIDYCKETGYSPPPLPSDIATEEKGFGSEGDRLEETSNVVEGVEGSTTPSSSTVPSTSPSSPTTPSSPDESEEGSSND